MPGYFLSRELVRHPDGTERHRPLLVRVTPLGVALIGPQDAGIQLLPIWRDGVVPDGEALFCTGTPPDNTLYRVRRLDPGDAPAVGIIRTGRIYGDNGELLGEFTYAPMRE